MLTFKQGRPFIRYKGRWLNAHLLSLSEGGGVRGYLRFFKNFSLCIFGKHRYQHVYRLKERKSSVECAYCRKEKTYG